MIPPKRVVDFVTAEPFRPFPIRVASGQSFDTRHPETVMVGRTTARVYMATEPDQPEKWHEVSLMLIESLEPIDLPNLPASH